MLNNLQSLYDFIENIPDETSFSKIPLSNFYITYEQKISQDKYAERLKVYRVLFDGFRLFLSVKGRSKPVCKFVYIGTAAP